MALCTAEDLPSAPSPMHKRWQRERPWMPHVMTAIEYFRKGGLLLAHRDDAFAEAGNSQTPDVRK